MFSLNGAVKYKYIPNYQDMRGGYDKLCGVIRSLGEDPEDGTAYVFTSKDQKIVKIIIAQILILLFWQLSFSFISIAY